MINLNTYSPSAEDSPYASVSVNWELEVVFGQRGICELNYLYILTIHLLFLFKFIPLTITAGNFESFPKTQNF